ncbi:putative ribosomal protein L2 [Helianthus annuus]|uniref:Ribosomal protein L2 n=1 Tax=Helianthus annuus TaxID=4232 RepID=A0A9K3DLJ7_HELAN|nr:putative ribosomal protein L2 [Helianthus annuus]KAJ0633606.1 putative ribosomal protein L2 [Helianthus annuus]
MAINLYKTSTPSTRNGTVDSQVKSNPRNNLIYGQHHCGKGRNARGIITAGHRGGARAAGAVAKLIAKEGKSATLKLPSGEVRLISKNCSATVGQVGNVGVNQKNLGRAGSKCWLGKRPVVRGPFIYIDPFYFAFTFG